MYTARILGHCLGIKRQEVLLLLAKRRVLGTQDLKLGYEGSIS